MRTFTITRADPLSLAQRFAAALRTTRYAPDARCDATGVVWTDPRGETVLCIARMPEPGETL